MTGKVVRDHRISSESPGIRNFCLGLEPEDGIFRMIESRSTVPAVVPFQTAFTCLSSLLLCPHMLGGTNGKRGR